jgi:2-amino-4-hydroxy-6-hydroxymethyldihydropteridine diphosphokinase
MSINQSHRTITAYIGLGANLGDATSQLMNAIALIAKLPMTTLISHSSLYASAPLDAPLGIHSPDYVNAVACVSTQLSAQALLDELRKIETQAGRVRSLRNAPRTLDLDVLMYGDEVINTEALQVPHPRMHQRAFVLLPLLEIAPDLVIPSVGKAADFIASVSDQRLHRLRSLEGKAA